MIYEYWDLESKIVFGNYKVNTIVSSEENFSRRIVYKKFYQDLT